jgi:hypothetical protein
MIHLERRKRTEMERQGKAVVEFLKTEKISIHSFVKRIQKTHQ